MAADKLNTIYRYLQDLANKSQGGGYIPPEQFNRQFKIASKSLFTSLAGAPESYLPGSPFPAQALDLTDKISDDVHPFLREITLSIDDNGNASKPSDYNRISAIWRNYADPYSGNLKKAPVEFIDNDKYADRFSNSIDFPTEEDPVVRYASSETYEFAPANLGYATMSYYIIPDEDAVWAYTPVQDEPVYDAANSIDTGWGEDNLKDLTEILLGYFGISIDSQLDLQYSNLERSKP